MQTIAPSTPCGPSSENFSACWHIAKAFLILHSLPYSLHVFDLRESEGEIGKEEENIVFEGNRPEAIKGEIRFVSSHIHT